MRPGNATEMIDTTTKATLASVTSSDQYSARPPTTPAIMRFVRERRSGFRISTIAYLRKGLRELRQRRRRSPVKRLRFPGGDVSHSDHRALEHLREGAATPRWA